jgi:hypothetical protein
MNVSSRNTANILARYLQIPRIRNRFAVGKPDLVYVQWTFRCTWYSVSFKNRRRRTQPYRRVEGLY